LNFRNTEDPEGARLRDEPSNASPTVAVERQLKVNSSQ